MATALDHVFSTGDKRKISNKNHGNEDSELKQKRR
jgi:hypothetical protein